MNLGGAIHLNKSGLCIIVTLFIVFFFYIFSQNAETIVARVASDEQINLNKLLAIAIKAAENGGLQILQTKDSLHIETKGKTKEGILDPVTSADFNSHCAMKLTLQHQFPRLLVISEEAAAKCDNTIVVDHSPSKLLSPNLSTDSDQSVNIKDLTVWIDPLDATKEFTEKQYQYVTTMVCVAIRGQPIIGVIHKPFINETFYGWVGNTVGNIREALQSEQNHRMRVIISMSHSGTIRKQLLESFNDKIDVIVAAGAGYKILEVVSGRVDAYLHSTAIKKWDICAGNAILKSVGGRMTTKDNKLLDYSGETNTVNSEGLVATIRNHDQFIGKF